MNSITDCLHINLGLGLSSSVNAFSRCHHLANRLTSLHKRAQQEPGKGVLGKMLWAGQDSVSKQRGGSEAHHYLIGALQHLTVTPDPGLPKSFSCMALPGRRNGLLESTCNK